jgi:hypothetical protein
MKPVLFLFLFLHLFHRVVYVFGFQLSCCHISRFTNGKISFKSEFLSYFTIFYRFLVSAKSAVFKLDQPLNRYSSRPLFLLQPDTSPSDLKPVRVVEKRPLPLRKRKNTEVENNVTASVQEPSVTVVKSSKKRRDVKSSVNTSKEVENLEEDQTEQLLFLVKEEFRSSWKKKQLVWTQRELKKSILRHFYEDTWPMSTNMTESFGSRWNPFSFLKSISQFAIGCLLDYVKKTYLPKIRQKEVVQELLLQQTYSNITKKITKMEEKKKKKEEEKALFLSSLSPAYQEYYWRLRSNQTLRQEIEDEEEEKLQIKMFHGPSYDEIAEEKILKPYEAFKKRKNQEYFEEYERQRIIDKLYLKSNSSYQPVTDEGTVEISELNETRSFEEEEIDNYKAKKKWQDLGNSTHTAFQLLFRLFFF